MYTVINQIVKKIMPQYTRRMIVQDKTLTWAERAFRLRVANGWSQRELGEQVGVTKLTVTLWENEKRTPTRMHQARLEQLEEESLH